MEGVTVLKYWHSVFKLFSCYHVNLFLTVFIKAGIKLGLGPMKTVQATHLLAAAIKLVI